MNNTIIIIFIVVVAALGGYFLLAGESAAPANNEDLEQTINNQEDADTNDVSEEVSSMPLVTPISHATFVLSWGETIIYNDPVGGAEAFAGQPAADIVLVSDIHGDHLSPETLQAVVGDAIIYAPQAVADEFSEALLEQTVVMNNGDALTAAGISIEAIPMYNLPEQGVEIRHEDGRGNGYLLERDGTRVYIAGDTADIPEMRELSDIDMAFVPMNLPYTMSVEAAADAVAEFAPVAVYPYHYRTPEGLSDVSEFERLVRDSAPTVEVILLDWYPEADEDA